jgi:hypothetical protein
MNLVENSNKDRECRESRYGETTDYSMSTGPKLSGARYPPNVKEGPYEIWVFDPMASELGGCYQAPDKHLARLNCAGRRTTAQEPDAISTVHIF